ncbi:MAG: hypothetical protein Q7U14_15850 [Lacisediminimonas sp.]|nr:hypothetical protein [Lacisediminimonas sp.]
MGYNTKPVEFQGKKFRSKKELASTFGLTGRLFGKRVKQGRTIEQALEIEPPPPRFRNFEGHAREQKWKEVRVSDRKVEPVPDADGCKLFLVTNTVNAKVYVCLPATKRCLIRRAPMRKVINFNSDLRPPVLR